MALAAGLKVLNNQNEDADRLRGQILFLENELSVLRKKLAAIESGEE